MIKTLVTVAMWCLSPNGSALPYGTVHVAPAEVSRYVNEAIVIAEGGELCHGDVERAMITVESASDVEMDTRWELYRSEGQWVGGWL